MDDSVSPFEPLFPYAQNARLDTSPTTGSSYAAGYFLAAQLVANRAREDKAERNLLALPVCYLLRHNIELNLKELIAIGQRVVGTTASHVKHHRIKDLWAVGKELLRGADPGKPDPSDFLRIDRVIDYISTVDEDAQAFRFPTRANGAQSLPNVTEIDLESLLEMANSTTLYLWGCIDWLDSLEQ